MKGKGDIMGKREFRKKRKGRDTSYRLRKRKGSIINMSYMKKSGESFLGFITCMTAFLLIMVTPSFIFGGKLPVVNGKEIVAKVNNEPITYEEFNSFLTTIGHEQENMEGQAVKIDYAGILERLINEKLFLQEAKNIGIDEFPEVKEAIKKNSEDTLIKLLIKEQLKNVKADPEDVEKYYKLAVRELKISAVIFEKESDAKEVKEALDAGGSFDDMMKKITEEGTAKQVIEGEYLKNRDLWPGVSFIISEMEVGSVSPVIKLSQGYAVLRLEDIRYPDDPEIRKKAERLAVKNKEEDFLGEYTDTLIEKYVKKDDELFDSIDYDASVENLEKLRDDPRVIAKVKNGLSITVGELTKAFEKKYYHGLEDQIKTKRLNAVKGNMLREMLQKRVLLIEALKQGLDKTEQYKDIIKKFTTSLVMGVFLDKVVSSDIRLAEDEVKKYYDKNAGKYVTPGMMKIDSLVFDVKDKAEDAFNKLRKGTDFKWLSANEEGQISKFKGTLRFDGNIINPATLPEDVQKVLAGAAPEDVRLFEGGDGFFYVLYVQNVYPSEPRPYNSVKKEIAEIIYNDKLKETINEWADKLKEHYKVEIYLTEF